MQVAICDSDRSFRSELHNHIVEYKRNKRIQADVYEFENGEDLLSSDLFFDLIFLGYRLPNANGMTVARELRSKNIPCSIVFITDYPDFVYESFEVNPYRFFQKPISKIKIEAMLDSFLGQQKRVYPFVIMEKGEQKIITSKDVIFLKGDGKYCFIYTSKDTLHSSKTLSEVLECLPQHYFCRIHKSYAVNMNYIASIDNKTVTLLNGEKVPISKSCLADFRKAYKVFVEHFYSVV